MLKWFLVADKGADLLTRWVAVLLGLSAGYSWLTKHATLLGSLNWPDAILIGIGLALVTVVVISGVLVAVRYFRPMAPPTTAAAATVEPEAPVKLNAAGLPEPPPPPKPVLRSLSRQQRELIGDVLAQIGPLANGRWMELSKRSNWNGDANLTAADCHARSEEVRQHAHDLHLEINQYRNDHQYALGLMGLDISPVCSAASAVEGQATTYRSETNTISDDAKPGVVYLMRKVSLPVSQAIGEYDHKLALVRARIEEIDRELNQ